MIHSRRLQQGIIKFSIVSAALLTSLFLLSAALGTNSALWPAVFSGLLLYLYLALRFSEDSRVKAAVDKRTAKLQRLAYEDCLTGLPNRQCFSEFSHNILEKDGIHRGNMTLMMIDLNLFKKVNDAHGHETGDQLLQVVANRLQCCLPEDAMVFRLGGDEFVVVFDSVVPTKDLDIFTASIKHELSRPVQLNSVQVRISASVGVATTGTGLNSVSSLLKQADLAMYTDKSLQRFYTTSKSDSCLTNSQMGSRFIKKIVRRDAIKENAGVSGLIDTCQ